MFKKDFRLLAIGAFTIILGFSMVFPVGAEEDSVPLTYESVETAIQEDEALPEEESQSGDTAVSLLKEGFVGQITEIEGTQVPTTILLKKLTFSKDSAGKVTVSKGEEATLNISSSTKLDYELSWWMAGDVIRVKGTQNDSTSLIDTTEIQHLSRSGKYNTGHNGWIEEINAEGGYIQVQWNNKLTKVNIVDGTTRIIIPGKGDVSFADLQVEDRVRIRGERVSDTEMNAKTVMVLRHGEKKFMKLRTKKLLVNFVSDNGDKTFTVEGRKQTYTVHITDKTVILKDREKKTDLSGLSAGDQIFLVARVNDDGSLDARIVRDFKSLNEGGAVMGTITRVDMTNETLYLKAGGMRNFEFRIDVTSSTQMVDESGKTLVLSDLSQGKRIQVEGTLAEDPDTKAHLVTASKITLVDASQVMARVKRMPMMK